MKKYLLGLFLLLTPLAYGQDVFAGFRIIQDFGFEMGLTFNRFGVKAFGAGDYHLLSTTDPKKSDFKDCTGERYHLVYGAGLLCRLGTPLWLCLDAGYGWSGKYGWNETGEIYGSTNTIKGLDIGVELMLHSDEYYISVGYETMPFSFKINNPVNLLTIAVGMYF
jgi:hypothetical protein